MWLSTSGCWPPRHRGPDPGAPGVRRRRAVHFGAYGRYTSPARLVVGPSSFGPAPTVAKWFGATGFGDRTGISLGRRPQRRERFGPGPQPRGRSLPPRAAADRAGRRRGGSGGGNSGGGGGGRSGGGGGRPPGRSGGSGGPRSGGSNRGGNRSGGRPPGRGSRSAAPVARVAEPEPVAEPMRTGHAEGTPASSITTVGGPCSSSSAPGNHRVRRHCGGGCGDRARHRRGRGRCRRRARGVDDGVARRHPASSCATLGARPGNDEESGARREPRRRVVRHHGGGAARHPRHRRVDAPGLGSRSQEWCGGTGGHVGPVATHSTRCVSRECSPTSSCT